MASLRKKIREEVKQTTPTHRFIRTLRDSKKLMRCYTQNIDGLEAREGLCMDFDRGKGTRNRFSKKALAVAQSPAQRIPGVRQDGGCEVVQLHGDLEVLRCTYCKTTCGWGEGGREALLLSGKAPECLSCTLQDQDRRDRGKRGTKIGTLRPNVVLYGEEHPSADAISTISTHDLGFAPDVLLILGTSLHVHGLKVLIKEFAKSVHARAGGKGKVIFVNLTKPSESAWKGVIDYWVSMDCDKWVGSLKRHRPDLWQIQSELKPRITKAGINVVVPKATTAANLIADDEKENTSIDNTEADKSRQKANPQSQKTKLALFDVTQGSKPTLSRPPPSKVASKDYKVYKPLVSQQLPTPPSSGRRRRFDDIASQSLVNETTLMSTPSKRKRAEMVIHEDSNPKRRRTQSDDDGLVDAGGKFRLPPTPSKQKQAEVIIYEDPNPKRRQIQGDGDAGNEREMFKALTTPSKRKHAAIAINNDSSPKCCR